MWKTLETSELKNRRNSFEDDVLHLLKECLPTDRCPRVVVLADRGFGDIALYTELEEDLGFDFVIRFRKNVFVEFTAIHDPNMKEPWFLASSMRGSIKALTGPYARRFTIEETFRDQKDMRFGWALYDVTVTQTLRRDRLLSLAALAQLGLDAKLRVNTVTKRRTHSLLRQGREYAKGLLAKVAHRVGERFRMLLAALPAETRTYATI